MSEIKLKPCPFCGAYAVGPDNETKAGLGSKRPVWSIYCALFCVAMRRDKKGKVIMDWNKRAQNTT